MLSYKLVHLIQYHSDALAAGLQRQVQIDRRTESYGNVSPAELTERVAEIYHHLGTWLLEKSDGDIARRYMEIGARRTEQNIPLSELVWVIVLTKRTLLEYVNDVSVPGRAAEVAEKQELLRLLDGFFDEAIHAAVVGHQQAGEASGKPGKRVRKAS
jgi:hypothetical protein